MNSPITTGKKTYSHRWSLINQSLKFLSFHSFCLLSLPINARQFKSSSVLNRIWTVRPNLIPCLPPREEVKVPVEEPDMDVYGERDPVRILYTYRKMGTWYWMSSRSKPFFLRIDRPWSDLGGIYQQRHSPLTFLHFNKCWQGRSYGYSLSLHQEPGHDECFRANDVAAVVRKDKAAQPVAGVSNFIIIRVIKARAVILRSQLLFLGSVKEIIEGTVESSSVLPGFLSTNLFMEWHS